MERLGDTLNRMATNPETPLVLAMAIEQARETPDMNAQTKQEVMPPRHEPPAITPSPVPADADSIMAVISRAAADPSTDVTKLERLLSMYERVKANTARAAYMAALSEMQPKLPIIGRKGRIEVREKVDGKRTGDVQQSTPYALWEDINEAIRPVLAAHGFNITFRYGITEDGRITVTGVLGHSAGHQEETTAVLMHDSTGSKNAVQAVGSSYSYGKRYTAIALLNITSRGEDDDGKAAGLGETITEQQEATLQGLLMEHDIPLPKFFKVMKIEKLADLPASRFPEAEKQIQDVIALRAAKKAKPQEQSA